MEGLIDTYEGYHINDIGYIMRWISQTTANMDGLGMIYSSEINLGENEMCDWGLDLRKNCMVGGIIYVWASEDYKKEYEQSKIKIYEN